MTVTKLKFLSLILFATCAITVSIANSQETSNLPEASASKLPLWRGFNLLEKFHRDWSNQPFVEEDFRLIHELGFNFVRLPLDYRIWVKDGDWNQLDEAQLKEIDRAVEFGKQYSIHVCLNFHRAPGYTVASPKELTDLWTDGETQQVCAKHWAAFAKRYRGIPNSQLSFNLFNEPPEDAGANFQRVVRNVVAAIREEDPTRLIISDGQAWGLKPVMEFRDLNIAQATRGYTPFNLTHYQANWVTGSDHFPVPQWPRPMAYGTLISQTKSDMPADKKVPLIVKGGFPVPTQMRLRVGSVSSRAKIVVEADGKSVFEKLFEPGAGRGEWKESTFRPQWNSYSGVYDADYTMTIPAGTRQIVAKVPEGDWMTITELGFSPVQSAADGSGEDVISLDTEWGKPAGELTYSPSSKGHVFQSVGMEDRQWLYDTTVAPWVEAKRNGIGVMVGEFGCYSHTPHDVTLRWMEDCLANWQHAEMGWALWNFRGGFGVLDSDRADVEYENFQGHKLDRKMLQLLQKY